MNKMYRGGARRAPRPGLRAGGWGRSVVRGGVCVCILECLDVSQNGGRVYAYMYIGECVMSVRTGRGHTHTLSLSYTQNDTRRHTYTYTRTHTDTHTYTFHLHTQRHRHRHRHTNHAMGVLRRRAHEEDGARGDGRLRRGEGDARVRALRRSEWRVDRGFAVGCGVCVTHSPFVRTTGTSTAHSPKR